MPRAPVACCTTGARARGLLWIERTTQGRPDLSKPTHAAAGSSRPRAVTCLRLGSRRALSRSRLWQGMLKVDFTALGRGLAGRSYRQGEKSGLRFSRKAAAPSLCSPLSQNLGFTSTR